LIYKRLNAKGHSEFQNEATARNSAALERPILDTGGKSAEDLLHVLKRGDVFMKYGHSGKPHKAFVQLTEDEKRIIWKPLVCTCFKRNRYIDTDTVRSFYNI
jgi:hypothetical protein